MGVSLGEHTGDTSRIDAFASAYCRYSGWRERRVNDFGSSSLSSVKRCVSLEDPVHFWWELAASKSKMRDVAHLVFFEDLPKCCSLGINEALQVFCIFVAPMN